MLGLSCHHSTLLPGTSAQLGSVSSNKCLSCLLHEGMCSSTMAPCVVCSVHVQQTPTVGCKLSLLPHLSHYLISIPHTDW
jgi:hypothetical protein